MGKYILLKNETEAMLLPLPPNFENDLSVLRIVETEKEPEPSDTVSSARPHPFTDSIFVKHNDYYRRIYFREVLWVEASGSYCRFRFRNDRDLLLSFSLSEVQPQFPPARFMRVHRSFLINLDHIDSLIGNSVRIGREMIPVSRRNRSQLMERLNVLNGRKHTPFPCDPE